MRKKISWKNLNSLDSDSDSEVVMVQSIHISAEALTKFHYNRLWRTVPDILKMEKSKFFPH
jgi:hypothetical protein